MSGPKLSDKPFQIDKLVVWEAFQRVKANKGAAGVDEQSIEEFERDAKGNLFKIWNRLSSGSYFPPPVKAVEIPEHGGGAGVRILGVPTVADRVAQTVVRMYLEPSVEPCSTPTPTATGRVSPCWMGRGMPATMLEKRLGDRSRHPGVLRQRAARPRAQGGRPSHRPEVDPALRAAVAHRPAARAGRHAGRPGSRNPTGFGDLAVVGEPVHALRVRPVDDPAIPGHPVRAVLR